MVLKQILVLALLQRRHRSNADRARGEEESLRAPTADTAYSIEVKPGMFSRSLLLDTDLVQLKSDRQAANCGYQPGYSSPLTLLALPATVQYSKAQCHAMSDAVAVLLVNSPHV